MARRSRRPRFHGPAADSALGEALLDVIGVVSAVGFAADVSQCAQLCGETFRAGDRGATNDMLVQSLRLQCGAREARAAGREEFAVPMPWGALRIFRGHDGADPCCCPQQPAASAAAHPARRAARPRR